MEILTSQKSPLQKSTQIIKNLATPQQPDSKNLGQLSAPLYCT